MKEMISVAGKPYVIIEGETGIFHILNRIIYNPVKFEFDEKRLVNGLNIKEVPNRNLTLLVESLESDSQSAIIYELRKFASVAFYDYISYEKFEGIYMGRHIAGSGNTCKFEVRPRVFRKIKED